MKTYLAFTVQVYKGMTPQGTLTDYAEVKVVAVDEAEALKKAKKILERKEYTYRVKMVDEYQYVENDTK